MNNNLFTSPIDETTWSGACGGGRCCIETNVVNGGFALRNTQDPDHVIRCTRQELEAFYAQIPEILNT